MLQGAIPRLLLVIQLIQTFFRLSTKHLISFLLHIFLHIDFHTILRIPEEYSVVAWRNVFGQSIDIRLQKGSYPRKHLFMLYAEAFSLKVFVDTLEVSPSEIYTFISNGVEKMM